MGILDHLWDDNVAGPRPDDGGLGKLRKNAAYSSRSGSGKESELAMIKGRRSFGEEAAEDIVKVTRSIMIARPPQGSQRDSPPASPAGSTPPLSPFAGTYWLQTNPSTSPIGPGQFSHSPAEEERRPFVFGGGRRPSLTRRHNDPGALVLLTTCDF